MKSRCGFYSKLGGVAEELGGGGGSSPPPVDETLILKSIE